MPSFNFTKFVDQVEEDLKPCTIRAKGKRIINVGDTLHLFTGMRTKNCRRLKCSPQTCINKIEIRTAGLGIFLRNPNTGKWVYMFEQHCKLLAVLDGFENLSKMLEYFTNNYTITFEGYLYQFRPNATLEFIIKSTIDEK